MLKRSFEVIVAISEKALAHWSALPQIDVRTEMTKASIPPPNLAFSLSRFFSSFFRFALCLCRAD